jgi:signal transduction histidine kinase
VIVDIDAERLGRVLRNLLANARKYSSERGTISVNVQDSPADVSIDVSDDGPGIPVQEQDRILERFYRVRGAGRPIPSTGLGLAIARGLVELHAGRLSVDSAPGHGSTFHVWLPRQ